jgi:hypothetical protein
MITASGRRRFLGQCAACAWVMTAGPAVAQQRRVKDIEGCMLLPGDLVALGLNTADFGALPDDRLIHSSGNPQLDKALGRAMARAARRFNVRPGFAFFQDQNAPNAFATSETKVNGTQGTVVFGKRLFTEQFSRYNDRGMSVIAIVAHEFGHILQYNRNLMGDLRGGEQTVRKIELHADYLAGWYLGLRKKEDSSISLWASGDTFRRIGDYAFNNPNHHGTPTQRVAASEGGFALGFHKGADVDGAVDEGRRHIHAMNLV